MAIDRSYKHDFSDIDIKKVKSNIRESVRRNCEEQARHTNQIPDELMEKAEETARLMTEKVDL
ncbi:MAG: hypothetical protein ABEJ65_06340 [bacterium]